MISRLEVCRVVLNVMDLDSCAAFYREVIGMRQRGRSAQQVTLGTRNATLVELRQAEKPRSSSGATGLFHMAVRLPSREDLGSWLRAFASHSSAEKRSLQGASDHGVSEALYLTDPEENGIEVYADRAREEWPTDDSGKISMYTAALDVEELLSRGGDDRLTEIPARSDLGHVHLSVSDIEEARRFYVGLLGLDLVMAYGDSALFLSTNGYHHQIGLNTWQSRGASPLPEGEPGLAEVHFSVRLDPRPAGRDINAEEHAGRLRSQNVKARTDGESAIRIADPSGIHLRLLLS